jgi:hypothetical protein
MGKSERSGAARTHNRDVLPEIHPQAERYGYLAQSRIGADINSQNRYHYPEADEILDQHISRVDDKIASLSSLRQDIVEYRVRITHALKGDTH